MSQYFSIAALFIMFREALEAAVIIAVLLQMLVKLKMPQYKKWVWIGAVGGVAISAVVGVVFVFVFYLANTRLLSDKASLIFKGCICWLASLLITTVAFAMLRFYNMERRWRHRMEDAMAQKRSSRSMQWSMLLLAGSATLREGIESVLFLTGVSAGSSVKAVIIPGAIGIVLGAIMGVVIYYTGRSIKSLKWFFVVSALLLLLIAAGMVVNGTADLQYAGLFGTMWPYEWRPWSNHVLWDTSNCCDPDTNDFWALVRALFGYQDQPMNLQLLYYCMFWALALGLLAWKWHNGTLTDRKEAELAAAKSMAVLRSTTGSSGKLGGGGSSDDGSSADVEMGAARGGDGSDAGGATAKTDSGGEGAAKDLSRKSRKDSANSVEAERQLAEAHAGAAVPAPTAPDAKAQVAC